ncbi:MAG: hypothetical protein JW946_05985 [Candidatus Omnitrophica bacterium]|nr:hypothetical protein [Candidatus Omnitrophota bacterium]
MKNRKYIFIFFILIITAMQIYTGRALSLNVKLSVDQRKLVDSFGYPNVFMKAMGDDGCLESWTYFKHEITYDFLNGKFLKDRQQKRFPKNFRWPKLKPTQFKKGMSEKEVEKILRNKPTSWGILKPEAAKGVKIYDYCDQVKVAFEKGRLIYVQTLPVPIDIKAAEKKQGGKK